MTGIVEVKHDGKTYLVSKYEYDAPARVALTAWEPATKGSNGFLTDGTHSHTYTDTKKQLWGAIDKRRWPKAIEMMTPRSPERVHAEQMFLAEADALAQLIISKAKFSKTHTKEETMEAEPNTRSSVKPEKKANPYAEQITKLLAVADFARLKQLATLNDVPVKDKDTAGLLKMRLMNAFRSMLTKGAAIKET